MEQQQQQQQVQQQQQQQLWGYRLCGDPIELLCRLLLLLEEARADASSNQQKVLRIDVHVHPKQAEVYIHLK